MSDPDHEEAMAEIQRLADLPPGPLAPKQPGDRSAAEAFEAAAQIIRAAPDYKPSSWVWDGGPIADKRKV